MPGGKFTTSCQLDISLYPFDRQACGLDFVDWTYDGRFVNLVNSSAEIGLDVYKTHGEWDITATESLRFDQFFGSDPGIPFPTVRFVLHLQRKPRYYLINVVAPCVLMSLLAMLVFYLPPDSGEKVSLGITVLLSFSVFLLLVADNVPKTSEDVPLIGTYCGVGFYGMIVVKRRAIVVFGQRGVRLVSSCGTGALSCGNECDDIRLIVKSHTSKMS